MAGECLFCDAAANIDASKGTLHEYHCDNCGKYQVGTSLEAAILKGGLPNFEDVKHRIAAHIRYNYIRGLKPPKFTSADFEQLCKDTHELSVSEKQIYLLKNLAILSPRPGAKVRITGEGYSLAQATSSKEFTFFIEALIERNLIRMKPGSGVVILTGMGWDYLDEIERTPIESRQGFVAMSFDSEHDDLWRLAIKPAIEDSGFIPRRVDKDEHNEKICDRIIREIKKSLFVVADFTGQKQGVYFEAGYGLGLGLPVIWTVSELDKNIHFDTRQYNHIIWQDHEDLKKRLQDRIEATIL